MIARVKSNITNVLRISPGQQRVLASYAGLLVLGLLSRGIFTTRMLYHWDLVNFAYALTDFDVAKAQPHIPGYILYVALLRVVNIFFNDPQASMVLVSVIASALAIVQLFRVGSLLFNRRAGLWAGLFLASSPLFWFYGEIALPHALDALFILVTIELLLRINRGEDYLSILTAIWLGIVGGFRPQTEFFLLPLAIYASRRTALRTRVYAALTLFITNLAWLVPMIVVTGSLQSYWDDISRLLHFL